MDKYDVRLLSRAYHSLDEIYGHIAENLLSVQAAEQLISALEDAFTSLAEMPCRGAKRRTGAYAGRGYRQLFIKNYIIVYRIDESAKQVIIVTIKYSKSKF